MTPLRKGGGIRGPRYRVRVRLSDRSLIKVGGYVNRDAARAAADRWLSEPVERSRIRNGAAIAVAVYVLDGSDNIVHSAEHMAGRAPEWQP